MTTNVDLALTPDLRAKWDRQGFLVLAEWLPAETRANLALWVDEVARAPEAGELRLHYREAADGGTLLCRTERFVEDHAPLRELVTTGALPEMAGKLLGEPVLLYKEKVNYKQSGGAGFAPHQDATAYAFATRHVTCLVAVDAMTVDNGCLEFSPYGGSELLPGDGDGCLDRAFAGTLSWEPAVVPAGAAVFFTSYVPHRSGPNRSPQARRALYLTYNAAAEGDRRAAYYAQRATSLESAQAAGSGQARVSTIGHFEGRAAP